MSEISLTFDRDKFNVLGIGVADNERTLILLFKDLIRSFCLTPNLCSSSIMSRFKFLNETCLLKRA